jgi:hypothetical protein
MEDRISVTKTGGSSIMTALGKGLVCVLLLLVLVPASSAPVSADTGPGVAGREPTADPLVRCQPASVSVPLNQLAVIDIYVQDVTNLYGADVMVSYDPTIGAVVDQDGFQPGAQIQPLYSWTIPGFIVRNGAYVPADNPPNCGVHCIWFAFTQFNPTPPANGSGPIARITFQGLQVGTFPMNWLYNHLGAPGGLPITPVTNQPCSVTFYDPLAVTLADFDAQQVADYVRVTWETVSELNNRGFNLYRGVSPAGWDTQLNSALIPSQSQGSSGGFVYTWDDHAGLVPDTTYYYWLEDVELSGVATMHGPVSVDFVAPTAVTVGRVQASPAAGAAALPLVGALLALLTPLAAAGLRRRA